MKKLTIILIATILFLILFFLPINIFFSVGITIKSPPEKIWEMYDKDNILLWDHNIESIKTDDIFDLGQKGVMKIKKGPAIHYEIIEYIENKSWTSQSKMPLGIKVNFIHKIENTDDNKIIVTHGFNVNKLIPGIIFYFINKSGLEKSLNNLRILLKK